MKNRNNIIKPVKIIIAFIILAFIPLTINAEENCIDLTENAKFYTNGMSTHSIADGEYNTYWYTNKTNGMYIKVKSEEPVKYIYVCYTDKPTEILIQTSNDGETWVDAEYDNDVLYHHLVYTMDEPVYYIKISQTDNSEGNFAISEIKIFSEGILPDYVQNWEPTYENADMLIFSAHPDDDAVFFSGIIPYYAGEMNKKITTVYMTTGKSYRHSEALNYNWFLYQRNLPLFANFPDVYEEDMTRYTESYWGKSETLSYLVSVIRAKKPDVIVTHDLKGEYGHGNHIFTAQCMLEAVVLANDPTYDVESFEKYGVHETKKLYLHLYNENQIHLDVFDQPLEAYDGLTAIEVAYPALEKYVSQLHWPVVKINGKDSAYSCYDYGLAYSTVGYDIKGNDMFENTEPTPTPSPVPIATPSPTPSPSPTYTPVPSAVPTAELVSNINAAESTILYIALGIIIAAIIFLIVIIIIKYRNN